MDFGDILKEWEKRGTSAKQAAWIRKHKTMDNKIPSGDIPLQKQEKIQLRNYLRSLKPQAELDLHGLTRREVLEKVDDFLKSSKTAGYKKVLIIHGKGNHSPSGPKLSGIVKEYLQNSPLAGEIGTPARELGGSGALWVILK